MPIWQQASPRLIPFKTINGGIRLDASTLEMPPNACLDAANWSIGLLGPVRSSLLQYYLASGYTVDYPPIRGVVNFYKADGSQVTIVFDRKFIYEVNPSSGFTGKYMTEAVGTIAATAGSVTITGTGTGWNSDVNPGDIIILDADGSGNGPEELEISSVGGATALDVSTAPTYNHAAGTDFVIRKAFAASTPYQVDYVVADNKVIFVDSNRYATAYDGTTYDEYTSSYTDIPTAVAYYMDRVWFGRIQTGAADHRQRWVWSKTTDHTDFSEGYFADTPYVRGYIQRGLPLGPMMVSYLTDSIWLGRRTNIGGNALPLAFDYAQSRVIGLTGPRAVCMWQDVHYFVSQDNIYANTNRGLVAIGTPVVTETIRKCSNPYNIFVTPDPTNDRIVFGFPTDGDIAKLWFFNYKAKAWSYDEVICTMIQNANVGSSLTWDSLNSGDYSTGTVDGTAAASAVVGTGTLWNANAAVGDTIFIDDDGDGEYEQWYEIDTVTDDTHLIVVGTLSASFAGKPYYIVAAADAWESLDSTYPTWDSMGQEDGAVSYFFIGKDGRLFTLSDSATTDYNGSTPTAVLVLGDYEEGTPSNDKYWSRLSLRIDRYLSGDVVFKIRYSTDQGRTWYTVDDDIKIAEGDLEGYTNFKARGSLIRFEISTSSTVESFAISQLTRRVLKRGLEISVED